MSKYVIRGGRALSGSISVSGSKNAALPILFASLAVRGESYIYNLPDIGDVRLTLEILESFGVKSRRSGSATIINTDTAEYSEECRALTSGLRASTYLIGSCLSRFGRVSLMDYGGCNFAARPIDIHIDAARAFGASERQGMLIADAIRPCSFKLRLKSVGATVNSLILAAGAAGTSVITGVAAEPHIDALISFLCSAGAKIYRQGSSLVVKGASLRGGRVTVPPDMVEAGSYLALSALFGGSVKVENAPRAELYSFLEPLIDSGAHFSRRGNECSLLSPPLRSAYIKTEPYPGFPTDLQPIVSVLFASGSGGRITEGVWRGRFGYLASLGAMGVASRVQGDDAEIYPSRIKPASVIAPDLRGGAAAMLLALVASGQTVIDRAELIKRGYESPEEKLRAIGADIELYE